MTEETSTELHPDANLAEQPKGHPKGLYLLFFTEMWERCSYYGMRAIFTLYMVNALLFDKAFASQIYGSYTGLVYLTPLLGGYIADRYWGNRRSIIVGGVLMAIGQFLMFTSGNFYSTPGTAKMIMFCGLGFLILGNGFFKPNISTMLGHLYPPSDRRVDSAFTIFYMGINAGALLAPFICGGLGEQYDAAQNVIPGAFKYGFLAACIGMILSLVIFIWLKNKYVVTHSGQPVGLPPVKVVKSATDEPKATLSNGTIATGMAVLAGLYCLFYFVLGIDVIGSIIFSSCIVLPGLIISDPSLTKIEKDRILVIYIIAFFVIFFWSAFEQAGASLTFFAQEQTDRNILGWTMPASFFQSFNAGFIVLLAPVAVAIWDWLGKRNMEPVSPVKQAIGLALLALGYLYIAWGVHGIQPWTKVPIYWLAGLYLIHTIGELCLSPIGLSMVVRLSPARFASLLMGVWFMSTATANKFAGNLSAYYPEEVKIENVSDASPAALEALKKSHMDASIWALSPKDNAPIAVAKVTKGEKESINSLETTDAKKDISVYFLKLIRAANAKIENAVVSEDGKYLYAYKKTEDKTQEGVKVTEKVEVWNLMPEKPSFLGMKINTLYDFFMIFVYMAGAAAILLFAIHKWLLKRMHGVR